MIETPQEQGARVYKEINKILDKEGFVFDIQMIPELRIVAKPSPVTIAKKDDLSLK